MGFKEIKADYQITAEAKDIDIARILRENVRDGMKNFVIVISKDVSIAFVTRKYTKRIEKLEILPEGTLTRIDEKLEYGFYDSFGNSFVNGEVIRSIGFTNGFTFKTEDVNKYVDILNSVEHVEKLREEKRLRALDKMGTIKVIAGK